MEESDDPGKRPIRNSKVGYKSPPESTRFAKGKSGNPYGRPKGAKNKLRPPDGDILGAMFLEEANREIKVNDGPKQITMPMAQAVIRSLAVAAVKGQPKSQQLFLKIYDEKQTKRKRSQEETFYTIIEYKEQSEAQIKLHAELGLEPPELYPHPKHIKIDWEAETFEILGPISKDEANQIKMQKKKILEEDYHGFQESIAELEQLLKTKKSKKYESLILRDIEYEKKLLRRLEILIKENSI